MVVDEIAELPAFNGTKKQKELAGRIFTLFQAHGRLFSDTAPIRISLSNLSEFLTGENDGKDMTKEIEKALGANDSVFAREVIDDETFFTTNRLGKLDILVDERTMDVHDLQERFTTPEPPRPRPERRDDFAIFEPEFDQPMADEDVVAYPPDSWQAAVAAALQDSTDSSSRIVSTSARSSALDDLDISDIIDRISTEIDEDRDLSLIANAEPVEAPVDVVIERPVETVDVATASVDELTEIIRASLSREVGIARWGDTWMAESNVPRLSRGDLRKIQEFLDDNAGPLTDVDLVADLRGIHANAPEFETERFALNYRLSREVRDFEYVGTANVGLWTTTTESTISSPKRKFNDIGQDYRYLLDYRLPDDDLEEGIIEHVLSFYEFTNGVLPLDANITTLMPKPAFSEQRVARLTFESPQTLETFVAELRFPSSNRGGFIVGLREFFEANLVPGALLTIEQTDQETHFIIEYFQMSRQDRKLLVLDEKQDVYVFSSTTYYCATQEEMLLTDNSFSKLENTKPLDERARRRPENIAAHAFEIAGEVIESDGAEHYRASLFDLFAVANIDRPMSAAFLRDIIAGGTFPEFSIDEDVEETYIYTPAK